MTGYNQYLTRRRNGFISEVISEDTWNVNVEVTVSAISAPMNTRNQLGGHRMDPPFTGVNVLQPVYGWGGNGSQFWERDEQGEKQEDEEEKKKKKAGRRKKKRSRHAGH
ncbi:hypothetical protein QQF64_008403 [Cirrhinus molitorella]|uniref:Uncharacterized protein n=1 Tax=Cirrhinus molitorella TaxID=172907 RepID=A0ABR3M8J5_9TELE